MYPSKQHRSFGVFVQKFVYQMESNGIICDLAVIRGRGSNVWEKVLKYIVFYFRLSYLYLFSKHQLVYIHYVAHVAPVILILRALKKSFLVCNFHGGDLLPDTKNEELLLPFSLMLAQKAELSVVPSSYYKKVLSEKISIKNPKILISASSGVDADKFKPSPTPATPKAKLTIGFVSRVDRDKGWDTFVLGLHKLKNEVSGIELCAIMVGAGAEMPQLKALVESCSLENQVKLVGEIPNNELPKYFSQMDLFIFPTTRISESLGLVGLEAMACGTPVLASEIGGITDYVIHEITGLLFKPGDVDDLVDKIRYWLKLPDLQKENIIRRGLQMSASFEEKTVSIKLIKELNQYYDAYQRG